MTITEYINDYLKRNHMTRSQFAEKSGFSKSYLTNLTSGVSSKGVPMAFPTRATLSKVAAATGVSVAELYSYLAPESAELGISEPKPEATEIRKSMSIIDIEIEDCLPKLSTHQKELVLAYIKGMLA